MATNQALVEQIYQLLTGGAIPGTATYGAGALGLRVDRAAVADAAGAWTTRFTIAGGLIAVTSLLAIRTVAQGGAAGTMQWRHSVGPTVLDSGIAVITGNAIGTIYVLTGDIGDAIEVGAAGVATTGGKAVATSGSYGNLPLFYVGAGNLQVMMTASTGTCSFIITYIPLNAAVTVVAV